MAPSDSQANPTQRECQTWPESVFETGRVAQVDANARRPYQATTAVLDWRGLPFESVRRALVGGG